MQSKSLLVLSLVVLALGAFIFFYEKDLPSTDERAEQAKKVLLTEEDAVESVLVEWDGQEVRLERQRPPEKAEDEKVESLSTTRTDHRWRITSPLSARADAVAVDGLVRSLTGLEASRTLEDFGRAELGLDEPRARVTLVSEDGQDVLEIGSEVPASNDMIVAVAGRGVAYQVAATVFDDLTKEPGEWRDKKLFTHTRGEIDRVTLAGGGDKVLLARRGDHLWIESPLTDRADEERVNALLTQLTGLRVKTFVDEPLLAPEGLGLAPAQGVVEAVVAGEEQPFRFELGHATEGGEGEGGTYYGRVEDQLFELETQLGESLALSAADWRSRSWTALQVFKVETARFADAEGVLEVSRDGADWKRGEDRIAYSAVSDLLYPITEAKGDQVVERDQAATLGHDLTMPVLEITLTTEDGEEELALYGAVDGLAAATSGGRDAVLLVAQDKVDEILDKLRELRSAEPLPKESAEEATADKSAADE